MRSVASLLICVIATHTASGWAAAAVRAPASASRAEAMSNAPVLPQRERTMVTNDLPAAIDAALADASDRTGVDRSRLVVVHAHAVTWADGSLGCPSPGRLYTQALVPGFRVQIQADAAILDYHASARNASRPFLCPAGRYRAPRSDPHI